MFSYNDIMHGYLGAINSNHIDKGYYKLLINCSKTLLKRSKLTKDCKSNLEKVISDCESRL